MDFKHNFIKCNILTRKTPPPNVTFFTFFFFFLKASLIHSILICLIGKFSFLIERLWHPPHVSHSWWHFSLILLPKIRVWRIKLCLKQNLRLLCEYCCQKVIDNFGLRSKRIEKEGQHLIMPFDKNTFNTFEYPATFDPACANWVWSAMWEGWMGAWRQGGEPCFNSDYFWLRQELSKCKCPFVRLSVQFKFIWSSLFSSLSEHNA